MPPRAELVWSPGRGQYRDANTGRWVSRARVAADMDRAVRESADRMAALAEQLRARSVDLVSWELAMRQEIKTTALYSAASARGGLAQLTASDLGRVGAFVKGQYDFLDNFAREIESGKQRTDGTLVQRARLYADAGWTLHVETEEREMVARGWDTYENILDPAAEHCEGPEGCVAQRDAGPSPVGSLIPIGRRRCKVKCRCRWKYSNSATGAVAA